MASPFPGMDPYLEQFWRDVHARLIIYAATSCRATCQATCGHASRSESSSSRGWARSAACIPTSASWNAAVATPRRWRGDEADVAVLEPVTLRLESEPMTETFIEIIDVGSGKRVVTVIEVVSLANKLPGDSRDKYRQKQEELRAGGVSLVEIDLLRAGQRRLGVPYHRVPVSHRTAYQVCVRRGWDPEAVEIYRGSAPPAVADRQGSVAADRCRRSAGPASR